MIHVQIDFFSRNIIIKTLGKMLPLCLSLLLIAAIALEIPVNYDVTAGRNASYTQWCKVVVNPSHAGYFWRELPEAFWATYHIWFSSDSKVQPVSGIQITASTDDKERYSNTEIVKAFASYEDFWDLNVYFTVNWGSLYSILYVGLLNPQNVTTFEYCALLSLSYGKCAANPDQNCSSIVKFTKNK